MVIDDLFGVAHAAVANFDSVAVKYFSKVVFTGEVLVDESEEFMSYVGADVFAVRGVVP